MSRTIKTRRPAHYHADHTVIYLPHDVTCLISPEDNDLAQYNWSLDGNGAAMRKGNPTNISMHRTILARKLGRTLQPNEKCDHSNGNPLDNRRQNLRPATDLENAKNHKPNAKNSSGYCGVTLASSVTRGKARRPRWVARIQINRKMHNLGTFDTAEEASRVYEAAAIKGFGEWYRGCVTEAVE